MSRYQPYPSYKDSGVEWLREVPEHWKIGRNKQVFKFVKNLVGENSSEYCLLSLSKNGIIPRDIESGKGKFPAEFNTYQEVKENDLIFCLFDIDETPRTIGISNDVGMITGAYNVARCYSGVDSKFIYYYYLSIDEYKGLKPFYTGLRKVVRSETFLNIQLGLPSLSEQTAIANFLDIQTAKIDTLIAKQERMIELLGEKRSAIIAHAVTKGVDTNVKMKDSGVEWLGEVPEHWAISKFSYLSNVVRGGSPRPAGDPTLFHGDYSPWVTVAEITKDTNKYLIETETFLTKKGSEQCRIFKAGTLLLSNSGATLGVPKILNIDANANDGVVGFENLDTKIAIEFAYFYLFSLTDNLRDRMNQGSGQPNLNTDIVKAISIPLPPFNEQNEIIAFLDVQTAKIDTLIAKARQAIELMKERRTALISAAVTGKIDVRGNI